MPLVDARRLDQVFAASSRPTEPGNEALIERAKALGPRDQILLELSLRNGLSTRQIARVLELPAGSVSRRKRLLCARLRDPLVVALLDPACPLSEEHRQIAIEHFAQCRTIRELSRHRQIPRAQVCALLHFVRGWFRAIHPNSRRAKSRA